MNEEVKYRSSYDLTLGIAIGAILMMILLYLLIINQQRANNRRLTQFKEQGDGFLILEQ